MPETAIQEREPFEHPDHSAPGRSAPRPVDEGDVLDWDAHVEVPPPRRSGMVRVRLVNVGRSRP
jgi:hypothetical protein